ncbi:hypothetical protein [Caproiciproducens galactitolivorans]|uniref:Uncharacterized protein n=1 Tax=Caproiciproducens galactitolivorans TaxID=642589 RepID=A0ABT4BVJ8_9FIRM|nr:hypothetical protein [Caproiciproducens galactitolivorans]MCY1714912.1 hypothetical protein [Caproiciproducens galactitolivorans]
MAKTYQDYFSIDPKYYASVTADLIAQKKVDWKGFYPHETFVKLLETTYRVLSGAASRSIWVEGAYGTGKSHAALTVKSLIDASEQEIEDYFDDYGLDTGLRNKYVALRSGSKIITVHRIGSASIQTDLDLVLAVQQSIMAALRAKGIENQGDASMRDAFLKWVEKPANRAYFSALIQEEKYVWNFGGMSAGDVIEKLKNGNSSQVESTMRNVMNVLKDNGQYGLFSDVNDMAKWIKSIIEENQLSAILFVWDEFSEYFLNHPVGLTGFQTLIEISLSHPFYFMIVAHESRNLFADADSAKKTLDRFEAPIKIELPENMAFRLMAQAMKTTDDPVLKKEWEEEDKPTLNSELAGVRNIIEQTSKKQSHLGRKTDISDKELQGIVPIHPYAALVLKHIATVFKSNQRSMFDFIISNDMTDAKGFKWYIANYGAQSDNNNLLTVDMLWDFFYGKERNGLNDDVRGVLDNFDTLQADKLLPEEQRVLKTILLLQAISLRVTGNELLVPNDQNVDLAFSGTDWNKGKAIAIANGLISKNILFKKPIAGGKFEYCAVSVSGGDSIGPYREKVIEETTTQGLIERAALMDSDINKAAVVFPAAINQRFCVREGTGFKAFSSTVSKVAQTNAPERFKVVITFAMDDTELQQIRQQILKTINMPSCEITFIETLTPMGKDLYDQYIESMSFSRYQLKKNDDQAMYYEKQAGTVLKDWRDKIASGAFMLYDAEHKGGQRMANYADLQDALQAFNVKWYPYGLEQYTLNATMYSVFQPAVGAGCGIEQKLSGSYSNTNRKMSFENALAGAWKVDKYWEESAKQSLAIVHIKKKVDEIVQNGFNGTSAQVSILDIYEALEKEPFGFMPSAVAALVLGFVLKEYVSADYFWSNGSKSEAMSLAKMKTMIANVIDHRVHPEKRYIPEYIRSMSPGLRQFLTCTSTVFRIQVSQCSSIEDARDNLRLKMKALSFPIWCIKHTLKDEILETDAVVVANIIDDYTSIANTANNSRATESESELAERIGKTVIEHPDVVRDLERLLTSEQCRKGMLEYIGQFQGGELPKLATQIGDGGSYIDCVKNRFTADDGNWVWNISTADSEITKTILEYKIVLESNKTLGKYISLKEVVAAWNSKTNNIKIPCESAVKLVGDLGPFLQQLFYLKQNNALLDQYKQKFYDLLLTQRESFEQFYKNQVPYFAQDAAAFLGDLETEDIAKLYADLPSGQFMKTKSDYYKYIQSAIDTFLKNQWKSRLSELWSSKTGGKTKDPWDWSETYETPILCMFDDAERSTARKMFSILKSTNPSEADAKSAMDYLENATFFDSLADSTLRDRNFINRIIGGYAVLLSDVAAVRKKLLSTVYDHVYEWMDNSSVRNEIQKMADKEYKLTGCDKASGIIDKMDANQLRIYLRDKISDDMDFGVQILKEE